LFSILGSIKEKKLPNQWRMFHPKSRRKNMIFWKKSCSLWQAKFWKEVSNEIERPIYKFYFFSKLSRGSKAR
jgi:hypothetical protein